MNIRFRSSIRWLVGILAVATVAAAAAVGSRWLPAAQHTAGNQAANQVGPEHDAAAHDPAEQHQPSHVPDDKHAPGDAADHQHQAGAQAGQGRASGDPDDQEHPQQPADGHQHEEADSLRLSKQAEANISLRLEKVELRPFERTITIPATVVQQPGRSQVQITAPFTGLVTRIYRLEGEAVTPGMSLFELQPTHEEMVQAQADFLRTAEELAVVKREVARLGSVAAQGAIAGKTLLERQYEQQKLEAVLHSQRQRLLLHRLTPEQVDGILASRTLLQKLTVSVPQPADAAGPDAAGRLFQVQKLSVDPGQHMAAGQPLGVLADHSELYIQGKAFEQDISALSAAVANRWEVTAVFQTNGDQPTMVPRLKILALGGEVETQSRAFYFYVTLHNKLVRDTGSDAGPRFIDWQFKPGQRTRLLVPVQRWTERIVLPVDAVVQDGAESYVFERNQEHFDRRRIHVEYRDQDWVVIANDGSLKPGVLVAVTGTYQIHLATKNKAGQGVDPHAGHNH